jgi:hypothetical protein
LPITPHNRVGEILPKSTHDAKYWARATKGMDFDDADLVGPVDFNRLLWKGMMGRKPYPAVPTKLDLRENREDLLALYQRSLRKKGTN